MDWLITRKLEKIGKKANPDKEFVRSLESRFLFSRPGHSPLFKYSAIAFTVLAVFLFGTGSYAYASDAVLPENALYPVRLQLEKIEDKLAVTSPMKARTRLKHAKRRLDERLLSDIKKKPVTEKQMQRFVSNIEGAIEANGKLSEADREEFDQLTARIESAFTSSLVDIREKTDNDTTKAQIDSIIEKQADLLDNRLNKLQEKRKEQFKRIIERRKQIKNKQRLESKDLPDFNPSQLRQVLP